MGKIHVKNGTPIGNCSMCDTCRNAHIVCGYRETEKLVYCGFTYEQLIAIPFKVRDCTNYLDKNRPTWEQMRKLAIQIDPATTLKPAGFRIGLDDEDDVDNEEVAAATETITGE